MKIRDDVELVTEIDQFLHMRFQKVPPHLGTENHAQLACHIIANA